jgi:two-component system CheB/CheR fusion protein
MSRGGGPQCRAVAAFLTLSDSVDTRRPGEDTHAMGASAEHAFPIVGVGASAGGLTPLKEMLGALPEKPGMAFVVIQHLAPRAESHLAQLLQTHTGMKVKTASHGQKVAPNHVYVIQPNTNVAITDGVLSVTQRPDDRRPYYPIDHFFRSVAMVQGPLAVGVVLSGTGSDGTLGLVEIKAAGGVTFAQDATAEHGEMPASAVQSGAVDLVLDPSRIGAKLAELPAHPFVSGKTPPEAAVEDGDDLHRVLVVLRRTSGVDFSQYRDTTIKRRTARRMLLRGFRSPREYARLLEADTGEAEALYRDVLINVTSFFRDPDMFDVLKRDVLPGLVSAVPESQPIRAWVAGCSTGQEAYSMAMALTEVMDEHRASLRLQVFATDVGDTASLDFARAGVYPESIEAEVSPERLRRFFVKEGQHYRVQKFLRECCVFARQNVTVDPPFSRVDLVSCRNVMIYMSVPLQDRLLPVFHFALNRNGVLVLGGAESIGRHTELFDVVDRNHKIFRRKEGPRRASLTFMTNEWSKPSLVQPAVHQAKPADFQRDADRLMLEAYAPPSVLVNHDLQIEQFRGRTSVFLEPPAGQPTTDILRMAKNDFLAELRTALTEARTTGAPVIRPGLRIAESGRDIDFTLRILPVARVDSQDGRLLVIFEPKGHPALDPAVAGTAGNTDIVRLRQELASARQQLQAMLDDEDAASQDLRAAHEEVLSSTEELQSTNEELETTKEELQSTNEELTTVNEQAQARNRELNALTDEMSNFLSSSDLPMVTVAPDLSIRRLTPAARRAFNLLPSDVGRSIDDIKFNLEIEDIAEPVKKVITSVSALDQEVRDRSGRWWLLQIRPFVTADNRVDGATLVAVDIDLVRRSRELMEARDYAMAVVRTVREPLVVLDEECRIGLANTAFHQLFDGTPESLDARLLWETGKGFWNQPALRRELEVACRGLRAIENLEVTRVLPGRGERTLVINAEAVRRDEKPALLLVAIQDVTDARRAEKLKIDAETLRLINRRKDEFLGILAHELRNPLAPMRFGLEVLQQTAGDRAAQSRAREVLRRQISHMTRIVDDLLDVSRISQGKIELRKESVKLEDIVAAAVEFCRPAADAAQHSLTVSLPDHPVILVGDSVRLTQVVVNLLNNAIKFTPPVGHIWVIAEVSEDSGAQVVRVRVRDTGIGIAPEMKDRIFEMFIQGDRSLERSSGGLGVGLTLVQNLVALHGGAVEASSNGTGLGSEFIVTLPVVNAESSRARRAAPVASARNAWPSRRVLLADDDEDGREMLAFLLRAEGQIVEVAEDGRQALDKAAEFHPEVVILDLGMPKMNGLDVARQLRAQPGGDQLRLIAMSGLGQAEDKARTREAGFDQHFTKPVDFNTLLASFTQQETGPRGGD